MVKMLKILLVGAAAFVILDAALFDGEYLAWLIRTAKEIWHQLNTLTWMPSR